MDDGVIVGNEIIHAEIADTVKRAKNGDTEAARQILRWFVDEIESCTSGNGQLYEVAGKTVKIEIEEQILRYLGGCFKQILADAPGDRVDANHALGIVEARKQGRKRTEKERISTLALGFDVYKAYKEIKGTKKQKLRGSDSPLDEVIATIAKRESKSIHVIKNAYDEFNKLFKSQG